MKCAAILDFSMMIDSSLMVHKPLGATPLEIFGCMITLNDIYQRAKWLARRLLSFLKRREKSDKSKTSMPEFEFRLRFNLLGNDHLKCDDEELELVRSDDGKRIRLRAGPRGSPIKSSSQIAITGGPYQSEGEALRVAQLAREAVVVWAVKQRLGVEFGDGKLRRFITDSGREHYQRQLGHPIRNDQLGIDVYEMQEGLLFASISLDLSVDKRADTFVDQFREGITMPLHLSEKQRLAAELYCFSFFDTSFRSRFITLVTAVEALLNPAVRSDNVERLVDDVKNMLSSLETDDATRESMRGSLDYMKYESIGQAARSLAASLLGNRKYGGARADRFFNRCYKLRSEIVHRGKPSDSTVDLLQESNALQAFVADLLLASFGVSVMET